MSGFVVAGDSSGAITLVAPDVAGTNTLTLPAETGTLLTSATNFAPYLPSFSALNIQQSRNSTQATYTATSYQDHGLSVSITPKSTASKILVITQVNGLHQNQATYAVYATFRLLRDSTVLVSPYATGPMNQSVNTTILVPGVTHVYLDTPGTTSPVTYKSQVASGGPAGGITLQYVSSQSTITVIEFK